MFSKYTANKGAAGTRESDEPHMPQQTLSMLKRIGSTTYKVSVHFSKTSNDTMADIVRRSLEREVRNSA